jgi:hypothetical protein
MEVNSIECILSSENIDEDSALSSQGPDSSKINRQIDMEACEVVGLALDRDLTMMILHNTMTDR